MAPRRTPESDPYVVLGVPRDATTDQIRTAYRARMKAVHPDAGGSERSAASVNAAYGILSDPARRTRWDRDHPADPPPTTRTAPPPPGHRPPPNRTQPPRATPTSPPPRTTPPPRPRPTGPPPRRRSQWPFIAVGGTVLVSLLLVFGVTATVPTADDSLAAEDDPFTIVAGDCVDLDQPIPADVPCESGRADGEVLSVTGAGVACPLGTEAVEGPAGATLCLDRFPGFEVLGCVDIRGNAVFPVECTPNPEAIISSIVGNATGCPIGTDATATLEDGRLACLVIP
jgi:hypothetical protein